MKTNSVTIVWFLLLIPLIQSVWAKERIFYENKLKTKVFLILLLNLTSINLSSTPRHPSKSCLTLLAF
jgi:hypothetical protein